MTDSPFSIAVFPFLKTTKPITIGGHTFRSTGDVTDLPSEKAQAVSEIARMLFVQDDLRVKSASYAIIPSLDLYSPSAAMDQLAYIRAVFAYMYSAPHEVFDDVFLAPEEVSLALFTPGPVSVFLVRPKHHTENVAVVTGPSPNKRHEVPGYKGLYNFRHPFWVEPGSRLYGPKPHITLNISQDLQIDLQQRFRGRPDYDLLLQLLDKALTPAAQRIYSALHWYNAANEESIDRDRALLNLAVAFETLLRLPDFSKTERLTDAITLLLGRTERLDEWAKQFYDARSRVAHEGLVQDPYFYVPSHLKPKRSVGLFGSLMLYGRHIFQLCLSTLLVGIDLADRADLQEKFISNNERYQKICDMLKSDTGTPAEKLVALEPTLRSLQRYRFVPSGEFARGSLITAVRYAVAALIATGQPFAPHLADAVARVDTKKRGDGEFQQLVAIKELTEAFEATDPASLSPEARIVRNLLEFAWLNLFQIYYWLEDRNKPEA
jgi:Apea-like HEPN